MTTPPSDPLAVLIDEASRPVALSLHDLVRRAVDEAGGRDPVVYVADYQQQTLAVLAGGSRGERIPVDGTLPGRAFQTQQGLTVEGDAGQVQVVLPVTDVVDRIGVLTVHFDRYHEEAARHTTRLAAAVGQLIVTRSRYSDEAEKLRRRADMTLAAEMQWNLLPPLAYATDRLRIAGQLEPAYDIGGDAFDYAVGDETGSLALFDAMGHGLASSLVGSLAIGSYRNSRRAGLGLTEVYRRMDAAIAEQFAGELFVTAQLFELDCETNRLTWMNIGHPLPILVRHDRVVGELPCEPTLPAGLGGAVEEIAEVALEPGDRVLVFSDGVIEARSEDGEQYGVERLEERLERAVAAGLPVTETVRRIVAAVRAHQQTELRDDATLLLLEIPRT